MSMDADIYMMYVKGMEQVEHEEILHSFTVSSYNKLSHQDRKKLHKNTYKCAYPLQFEKPVNVIRTSDLAKVLG